MYRKLQLFVFILAAVLCSSVNIQAAPSNPENFYQQFKDYFAKPILQVLKPELLQEMMVPRSSDENKSYFTIDGIEKIAWSERIKQRNQWHQKSIVDTINIDSILRLNSGENSDDIFTVSDGDEGLDPTNPDVAYDTVNQKYLVVWEEETAPGIFNIMAQFRDRNGMPMGSPTLISSPRTTQGCFYAAFDTDNGSVSTPSQCPKAANPAVAYNNGRFIITWELKGRADHARNSDGSANEDGKNFSNIIAKVVNAENLTPVSPAWQEGIIISRVWISSNVGTPVANDEQVQAWAKSVNPDVAPKLGGDGFVVTWESDKDFLGCVDANRRASSSVFARYIDQNFSPTGGAANKPIFTVYTDPSTITPICPTLDNVMKAVKPRIAYNTTRSDFVIAFEYARARGASKGDIGAKKVSLNNSNDATVSNSMAADIIAEAPEGTTFRNPDVASYAANTVLAYDNSNNIYLKRLSTNPTNVTPMGEATNVSLVGAGATTEPRIASNLSVGGTRAAPSVVPERVLISYIQGGVMKWAITNDTYTVTRGPGSFPVMANNNHLSEVASDASNFFVVWAGTPAGSMIENVFGASVNSTADLEPPVLTAPANAAVVSTPSVTLTWNAVAGVGIVYDVYHSVGGAPLAMVSPGQTGTTYNLMGLTSQSSHQWKVIVRDSLSRTADSGPRSFTVGNLNMPTAPVLTAQPADNVTWAPTRLYLSWAASTDADVGDTVTYDVYFVQGMNIPMGAPAYRTGVTGTSFVIQASTDNRAQYQPNVPGVMPIYLAPNTNYAWKICANDGRNNPPGITCSPVRRFNTDNSVVGWWRFDTNPVGAACPGILGGPAGDPGETVCDYSGFGNHGVPNGGPVWMPPPDPMLLGGALQFDGVNDKVIVNNSLSLNPTSVSVQSKFTIMAPNGGSQDILDKRSGGFGYDLRVSGNANPLTVTFFVKSDVSSEEFETQSNVIMVGVRQVVTGTYDHASQKVSLYRNGILIGSHIIGGLFSRSVPSADSAILGDRSFDAPSPHWLNGVIDDMVIFNKELSIEEAINSHNHY